MARRTIAIAAVEGGMATRVGRATGVGFLLAMFLLPNGALAAPPVSTVSTAPYYFPTTEHYLSGRFRQYWEGNGGLYVFGLPLTSVYDETAADGKVYKTQYFERARFEYHPQNAQPYDVLLTLFGTEITAQRQAEPPFAPTPARDDFGYRYAAVTQHNLHGGFLDFWQRYGGVQTFGYPLSEEFPEVSATNGKPYTVQYFERTRFEYHPEYAGSDAEISLGLIGLERLNRVGVPGAARAPETSPPTGNTIPGGRLGQ